MTELTQARIGTLRHSRTHREHQYLAARRRSVLVIGECYIRNDDPRAAASALRTWGNSYGRSAEVLRSEVERNPLPSKENPLGQDVMHAALRVTGTVILPTYHGDWRLECATEAQLAILARSKR